MNWLFVAFGLLLSLAGAWLVYLGADINQRGQDWAQLVAGAVLVSGGAVTLALAMLMFKLDALRKAFRKAAAAPAPAIPLAISVPLPPPHPPATAPVPPLVHPEPVEELAPSPLRAKPVRVAGAFAAAAGAAAVLPARPHVPLAEMPQPHPPETGDWPLPAVAADTADEPEIPARLPPVPDFHMPPLPEHGAARVPLPLPVAEAPQFISGKAEAELTAILAPPPHHVPGVDARRDVSVPLDGDWLDQALSGDPSDPLSFNPQPQTTLAPIVPQAAIQAGAEPEVADEDHSLEDEVTREMSFARSPAPSGPPLIPVPETLREAPPVAARNDIIGRHKVGNVEYVMYADGSIEADDGGSRRHFGSMAELKAHLVQAV